MNSKSEFSAVIADDHAMVRSALASMLTDVDQMIGYRISISAEATNGIEAISAVRKYRPDLMLLDVSMPHAGGTEVLLEVRRWSPDTKVIVYTGIEASGKIAELVETGADGLFSKADENHELVQSIPRILEGGRHVCQRFTALLESAADRENMTSREIQVLNLVIAGQKNQEIADMLGISIKTVDRHRTGLMRKTDTHSAAELISYALREQLIDPSASV